jgi:two-component system, NarL family, nitrate/nitrite response regulator NarL
MCLDSTYRSQGNFDVTASMVPDELGPVRVLIVSDIRLHRESLVQCLASFAGLTVVGHSSSPTEALHAVIECRPEVILLDIGSERSLELATLLNHEKPTVKIIAYGVHDREQEVIACAEAGVGGCFPWDGSLSELAAAVIGSRRDEMCCSPKAVTALFRRVASLTRLAPPESDVLPLTGRETEILTHIARGLSNKEIAQQLNIEVPTVKNHVHNILEKLQVSSRHHAVRRMRMEALRSLGRIAG